MDEFVSLRNGEIINKIIIESLDGPENYIIGFAYLEDCIDQDFSNYKYGISIGKRLDDTVINRVKTEPTMEYLNLYNEVNEVLAGLIDKIALELGKQNFSCISIPPIPEKMNPDEQLDFNKMLRYKLSHKMVATRAGLGWIGKTSLFISHKFGPRVRLGSILLKNTLPVTERPINSSLCGECNLCVKACPVQAANGELWDINVDRDAFLDVYKCRKYIFNNYYKKEIMLCGICINVCPVGIHNVEYKNKIFKDFQQTND